MGPIGHREPPAWLEYLLLMSILAAGGLLGIIVSAIVTAHMAPAAAEFWSVVITLAGVFGVGGTAFVIVFRRL